jgi:transcription antitermination factor NusG
MQVSESSQWYAIRVKSNRERVTAQALEGKDYEVFLPVYRESRYRNQVERSVEVPLFGGYLFCRFDPKYRLPILTVPGVVHIVGFGKTVQPVDEQEIAAVFDVVRSGLAVSPHTYLPVGRQVRIGKGPLRGTGGIILENKDGRRLIVSVSLLQRSVAVELEPDWIEPAAAEFQN